METSESSFEANFVSCFFEDDLFAFVLFVGVVELGNLKQNPKSLAVELLSQVGIKELRQFEVFGYSKESQDIPERRAVVFNSLFWIFVENLKLFIDDFVCLRTKLNQKLEESDVVQESANGLDRNVLLLVYHVN